jgi:hypothetical protein
MKKVEGTADAVGYFLFNLCKLSSPISAILSAHSIVVFQRQQIQPIFNALSYHPKFLLYSLLCLL